MRTGIMGGTFNPPHNAHLLIAEIAREQYGLDRVIFITGGNPPHKTGAAPAKHRFNMTRLAISGNETFTDDSFEIESGEKSYTVNTLKFLTEKYPSDELFFIIGEDSLNDLEKWYKPDEILKMCSILVFPRVSQRQLEETVKDTAKKTGGRIFSINAPVMEISSTDIRERIKSGKTVRYMLPDKVLDYIKKHNLYGDNYEG